MCAKGCCVISSLAWHCLGMNRRGFNSQTMSLYTNNYEERNGFRENSFADFLFLFVLQTRII